MIDWITARVPVRAASQLKTGGIASWDPDGVSNWITTRSAASGHLTCCGVFKPYSQRID